MPFMIILVYFDWAGNGTELKKWNEKFSETCEKFGFEFKGLYGPLNEKYNHVWIIEVNSIDKFIEMAKTFNRPKVMTHFESEILIPQIVE